MIDKLNEAYIFSEGRKSILCRLERSNKPVVVYGSGKFALSAAKALINNNIEIEKPLLSTKPWARPAMDALQTLLLILM